MRKSLIAFSAVKFDDLNKSSLAQLAKNAYKLADKEGELTILKLERDVIKEVVESLD